MKKAIKFTYLLAIWIICIGTVGLFYTYINDYLNSIDFFGDTKTYPYGGTYLYTEWGARHYWYYWICLCLFLLSVVRMIVWAYYYWVKEN